jgi:hypothetical protein
MVSKSSSLGWREKQPRRKVRVAAIYVVALKDDIRIFAAMSTL